MSRFYLYGALLVCAAVFYLGYRHLETAQWTNYSMPASVLVGGVKNARADGQTDADSLRLRMLKPYRLVPDRRLTRAIADVDRMIGISDSAAVATEFHDGRWWVTRGDRSIGSLPEFPDFESLDSLLIGWATTRLGEVRLATPPKSRETPAIAEALSRIDALWATRLVDKSWREGAQSPALLGQAARSLTWLSLETVDRVGTSDPVRARAFAALAVARASGVAGLERETCLLAQTMDYYSASRRMAAALPEKDPVRLFVERDGEGLLAAAGAKSATTQDRYLYLLHLARAGDMNRWLKWSKHFDAGSAVTLNVLSSGLAIQNFEAHEPLGAMVLLAVATGLDGSGLAPGKGGRRFEDAKLGELIHDFESVIENPQNTATGPFFDAELFQSHYRSLFYSALDDIGSHYLESLSSVEATKWFSASMGDSGGGAGSAFQRWYAHLAAAKSGHADLAALERDIEDTGVFGAPLLFRTIDEVGNMLATGDTRMRPDLRRAARRLDGRPEQRWEFGWNLMMYLQVINQAERMNMTAADAMGVDAPGLAGWCARYSADPIRFAALLDDPRLDSQGRTTILALAEKNDALPQDAIVRAFEKEIAADPDEWRSANAYMKHLEDRKQYAKARDVMKRWLARPTRTDRALEEVLATSAIGRLYDEEGLYADGLRAVGDVEESYQFGAMKTKAFLLYHAGRKEEAMKVAFAAWRRYPDDAKSRMPLVEMLWRSSRYADAAAVLTDKPYILDGSDWMREVAPKLIECFKNKPDEALKAIRPLRERGILQGPIAAAIATIASRQGDDRLAFELVSGNKPGGVDELQLTAAAYNYLKRWKGEAEALSWIKAHTTVEARTIIHIFAFQFACDELVWTLENKPTSDVEADYLWLMRAAAIVRKPELANRRQELIDHLAKTKGSYYLVTARYLLGLADLHDVLALANTGKRQCELYYFIGVRAQAEGRLRDAADWYAMSVETGLSNNGEWRWAYYQLSEWLGESRNLDAIAAKKGQPRA